MWASNNSKRAIDVTLDLVTSKFEVDRFSSVGLMTYIATHTAYLLASANKYNDIFLVPHVLTFWGRIYLSHPVRESIFAMIWQSLQDFSIPT